MRTTTYAPPRGAQVSATTHSATAPREQQASARRIVQLAFRFAFAPTRRNVLHWASWAISLAAVLTLVFLLQDGQVYGWEQSVARELQDVPHARTSFEISSTLTNSLTLPFVALILLLAALFIYLRHPGAAALMLLTFPLHVLTNFPKAIVDRPRPSDPFDGIEGVGGFQSFPSGHSEFVITFWGFLAYFVMVHLNRPWQRWSIFSAWLVLVLTTGFGRISEGRHWPLDVLFGYIVGLGALSGIIWLHSAFRHARDAAREEQGLLDTISVGTPTAAGLPNPARIGRSDDDD
jgi:membrane-associated phospholipid phosphatase